MCVPDTIGSGRVDWLSSWGCRQSLQGERFWLNGLVLIMAFY